MTSTCQIDFYVLQDDSLSSEQLACRLALMAWEQGHRTMVLAENHAQAQQLDTLMWEYPTGRFLPHAQKPEALSAPVVIGTIAELTDDAGEVIINLTGTAVPEPYRFSRLLELVPADTTRRSESRDKFRAYRALGLEPLSHSIGQQNAPLGHNTQRG